MLSSALCENHWSVECYMRRKIISSPKNNILFCHTVLDNFPHFMHRHFVVLSECFIRWKIRIFNNCRISCECTDSFRQNRRKLWNECWYMLKMWFDLVETWKCLHLLAWPMSMSMYTVHRKQNISNICYMSCNSYFWHLLFSEFIR